MHGTSLFCLPLCESTRHPFFRQSLFFSSSFSLLLLLSLHTARTTHKMPIAPLLCCIPDDNLERRPPGQGAGRLQTCAVCLRSTPATEGSPPLARPNRPRHAHSAGKLVTSSSLTPSDACSLHKLFDAEKTRRCRQKINLRSATLQH